MIERYSREEMIAIWTEQAQFDAWLDVELAACWAWSQIGVIPQKDVDTLYQKASFSLERIKEIEEQTRHDVVAFTRAVSETLGDEKKWVHYGLTSTDVVDTAWGVRLKKANKILRNDLHRMIDVLKNKALDYKYTMMMGRTHGIHAVGGWAALAGAMVVGPRAGKYIDGKPQLIKGHSLPLAALGVFILWLGWFGFNAGSTTTGDTSIALIALNTFLAAGAGATAAMLITWITNGKPDGAVTLNGVLAGLVGITAGCANLSPGFAIITGAIAGVLVHYSMKFLEKKVDDAVGAVSVHGVCGAWGTLAAGLFDIGGFSLEVVGVQLIGIGAAFAWTFSVSYILFKVINAVLPLRVTEQLEEMGLDIHEHDAEAYPEFTPSAGIG